MRKIYEKNRLKKEKSIDIDKIILLISVLNVRSKLLLGVNPPEDIIERE